MGAGVPVGKGRNGRSRVAFEADEGLGLWRKVVDVEKCACVTLFLFLVVKLDIIADIGNGQASRSMTRLTVDQGKSGFRLDLFAMDTVPEVIGDLVVLVTLRDAIVRSHILRIQPADNHLFVFTHGENRLALLEFGACAGQQGKGTSHY